MWVKTNNELYHHGIEGQKWGTRNGPPYPLGYKKHSRAELKEMSPEQRYKAKQVDKSYRYGYGKVSTKYINKANDLEEKYTKVTSKYRKKSEKAYRKSDTSKSERYDNRLENKQKRIDKKIDKALRGHSIAEELLKSEIAQIQVANWKKDRRQRRRALIGKAFVGYFFGGPIGEAIVVSTHLSRRNRLSKEQKKEATARGLERAEQMRRELDRSRKKK